jgi:hypothetical protein
MQMRSALRLSAQARAKLREIVYENCMASGNVGDGDVFGHLIEGAIAPKKRLGVLQPFSRDR